MDGRARSTRRTTATVALATAWAGALAVNRSLRTVRGPSMEPTLHDGDLLAVVPWVRGRRDDVVLVRDPREPSRVTVKRLLGLPGEELRLLDGMLHVDGMLHDEPWATGHTPDATLHVPAGHVAVLGDARDRSTDSRVFGPVPLALVEGRVVARVGPAPRLLSASGPGRLSGRPPASWRIR
jgi:signal peptidase I